MPKCFWLKEATLQHARYGVKDETNTDSEAVKIGQKLVGANGGFACVICHDAGLKSHGPRVKLSNICVRERLTKDYYHRWMLNPCLVPTTKVPKYADSKGKSPMADYGNDAVKQFETIEQYPEDSSEIIKLKAELKPAPPFTFSQKIYIETLKHLS